VTKTKQAMVVRQALRKFCEASGQKACLTTYWDHKTKVLFSKNMVQISKVRISSALGFTRTTYLGRYLGMPLIQGRVSAYFLIATIEQKMDRRIASWKTEKFSLAGGITLAKSVLCATPAFAMQTVTASPSKGRFARGLGGTSNESKKVHLVSWEKACWKKEDGGLDMNPTSFAQYAGQGLFYYCLVPDSRPNSRSFLHFGSDIIQPRQTKTTSIL
jgi:hypothetical protein